MTPHFEIARIFDVTVVRLATKIGTISQIDFDKVEQQVIAEAQKVGRWKVLLDMERVDYFHSLGISFLVRLSHALKAKGGSLRLCNLQVQTQEILTLTRVSEFLNIKSTEDRAMDGWADMSFRL